MTTSPIPADRVLTQDECATIFERVVNMTSKDGDTLVAIEGSWRGSLRWAMNRIISSGDTRNHTVYVRRKIRGTWGMASTNQFDAESLQTAVADAERATLWFREKWDAPRMLQPQEYLRPSLFHAATYRLLAQERSDTVRELAGPVQEAGLIAAGYLEATAKTRSVHNTQGMAQYYAETNAQYSVTIRDTKGTASGWAGLDHMDWSRIDPQAITNTAMEKCRNSMNPRMIEPGRYTTILEPQAVYQLMSIAVSALRTRSFSESQPNAPYFQGKRDGWPGTFSKIGLKIFDSRVTIETDPMTPGGGYLPFSIDIRDEGEAYRPTTWIKDGVLQHLGHMRDYATTRLHQTLPIIHTNAFTMAGTSTSLEEMIQSTRRGLIVTRLSGIKVIDSSTLLCIGVSRDGLWLIENGKVSTAAKNMRFLESPFFAFNNIEQIGVPSRVFSPDAPAIVPPVKVRDFTFASLADAV